MGYRKRPDQEDSGQASDTPQMERPVEELRQPAGAAQSKLHLRRRLRMQLRLSKTQLRLLPRLKDKQTMLCVSASKR